MKRTLTIALLSVLAFSLLACAAPTSEIPTPTVYESTEQIGKYTHTIEGVHTPEESGATVVQVEQTWTYTPELEEEDTVECLETSVNIENCEEVGFNGDVWKVLRKGTIIVYNLEGQVSATLNGGDITGKSEFDVQPNDIIRIERPEEGQTKFHFRFLPSWEQ